MVIHLVEVFIVFTKNVLGYVGIPSPGSVRYSFVPSCHVYEVVSEKIF
jgi:hypothetical protein